MATTTIQSSPIMPSASFSPVAPSFIPAGGAYPTTAAYPPSSTVGVPYGVVDPLSAHNQSVNVKEQKFLAKEHKQEAKRAQKNAKIAEKDWAKSEKLYAKAADLSARGKEDRAIKKQDKAARLAAAAHVHQTAAAIAQQEVNRGLLQQQQVLPSSLVSPASLPSSSLYNSGRSIYTPGRSFIQPSAYYSTAYGYTTGPVLVSTVSGGVLSSPLPSLPVAGYPSSPSSLNMNGIPAQASPSSVNPESSAPGYIHYQPPTSNDLSFADLRQIFAKYTTTTPGGALGRLFEIVEKDSKGRMSQATLSQIDSDLSSLVADFRRIDVNNNNTLSRKELRDYYKNLGFEKKSVVDALFRVADEDESDSVGFNEFVHLALCLLVLRLLFNMEDKDNSGQLSKDEMRKVLMDTALAGAVERKYDNMFAYVDSDESGSLNYYEFVRLVLLIVD